MFNNPSYEKVKRFIQYCTLEKLAEKAQTELLRRRESEVYFIFALL